VRVALVLKQSAVYQPKHVQALARQIEEHLDFPEVVCFSDVPVKGVDVIPLEHNWPNWWSKLEIFSPAVKGDILFFDLDTVVIGDLRDIAAVGKLTILRDFSRDGVRRPEGLQSCLMYLPEADRAEVWDAFARSPGAAMAEHAKGGDQEFLERFYLKRAARYQDLVPGQIVSYKWHCRERGVPKDARVLAFHGRPKSWDIPAYKHLYE
jgi:hypothetical protein